MEGEDRRETRVCCGDGAGVGTIDTSTVQLLKNRAVNVLSIFYG